MRCPFVAKPRDCLILESYTVEKYSTNKSEKNRRWLWSNQVGGAQDSPLSIGSLAQIGNNDECPLLAVSCQSTMSAFDMKRT